jgi:hypothetical protein
MRSLLTIAAVGIIVFVLFPVIQHDAVYPVVVRGTLEFEERPQALSQSMVIALHSHSEVDDLEQVGLALRFAREFHRDPRHEKDPFCDESSPPAFPRNVGGGSVAPGGEFEFIVGISWSWGESAVGIRYGDRRPDPSSEIGCLALVVKGERARLLSTSTRGATLREDCIHPHAILDVGAVRVPRDLVDD